jgi:hypothetical protein
MVEYVSELKHLWSDLDYYDPIKLECGKCVEEFGKWTERKHVRDFLNGHNSKYEKRRAALHGSGKLPSLEWAISAIISEETRLKLEEIVPATQGMAQRCSTLFATEYSNYQKLRIPAHNRNGFECGSPGHLRSVFPKLIDGGRGQGQVWRGHGRGRLPQGHGGGGRG